MAEHQPGPPIARRELAVLLAIVGLGLALNLYNNSFPLGYHIDEPKKVQFIATGSQDFHHPLLMLQLVRWTNAVLRLEDPQSVIVLGRTITAICGALTILPSWWLARRIGGRRVACLCALAVATSPILVIHAHYLKEDTLLTLCVMLSLVSLVCFTERPRPSTAIVLGICLGLAWSSHYKSSLLLVLLWVPLLLHRTDVRAYVLHGLGAVAVGGCVFLIVNLPIFDAPRMFLNGVAHEARHAVAGHRLKVYPGPYLFSFHLLYSVLPGMTPVLALLGVTGLVMTLLRWQKVSWIQRLLAVQVGLFYFAVEVSPTKPAPDFARYVIPIVPGLAILACALLPSAWRTWRASWQRSLIAGIAAGALLLPVVDTVLLDYHLARDTRARAAEWIRQSGREAIYERYAGTHWDDVVYSITYESFPDDQQERPLLVTTSFQYELYERGGSMRAQDQVVYDLHHDYWKLFKDRHHVEFRPRYRSFAFSNPTVRIIDPQSRRDFDACRSGMR